MKGLALERLSREELKKIVRQFWLENLALRKRIEQLESAQQVAQR